MKTIMLLAALLLCCTTAFGQTGADKLPLVKKIGTEKLILAEKFQNALEKCRERPRKRAKESCFEQKKNEFSQRMAELEQNPKAYFAAQERNTLDEKSLQEKNPPRSRQ